jgi:uncharacterized RDD family membrane protein YckC
MQEVDNSNYTEKQTAPATPIMAAGTWRRIVAFAADALILGAVGLAAGAILSRPFAVLGPWGQVVGFIIALAYFGFTQSSKGGGRSPGMRLLGLKVIRQDGGLLELRQSVARAGIFCAAYFLISLPNYLSGGNPWINAILSTPLFAVYFGIIYLLIFNRRTRQSLHDLALRTYVVKAADGPLALPAGPVWRGHAMIAGGMIAVLTVLGLVAMLPIWQNNPFTSMLQLQQQVARLPGVYDAVVSVNFPQSQQGAAPNLSVNATIAHSVSDRDGAARRIARTVLDNYPDADRLQAVTVTLSSGYNIGIAHSYRNWRYSHTPADWQVTP